MPSAELLPSGRFRGVARVKTLREAQVFDRREEALRWAEKAEERMRAGKWQPPPKKSSGERRADGLTVKQACEAYLVSEEFRGLAENTRANEPSKQKAVIRLLGSKLLTEVTPDDVREFIATRRTEKPSRAGKGDTMSAHGVRLEMASLSSVCNYAITRKWLTTNPCKGVRRPRGDRRTRRLTDDEIGKVLDAMIGAEEHETGYVYFRLLFTTVCRPGELAGARREWLREDPPQIFLPRTKNEDERTIILTVTNFAMLQRFLKTQPDDCPYLFGTRKRDGKSWAPYNYRVAWEKALSKAGLEGLGLVPYLARHEGISRLFERTSLSDGQIAGISGHRSAQALWHYKHLRNEHQRPTMNALDAMVHQAIDKAISHLAPYTKLEPGQMLDAALRPDPGDAPAAGHFKGR
jgi:integrase